MEYFIFRNELGQQVEFSLFSPYIFQPISESLASDIVSTKQIGQDGERAESWTLQARRITIQGSIIVREYHEELERNLLRILNPKLGAKLICHRDNSTKEIQVMLEELPSLKRRGGTIEFTINLIAHDPYWREVEKTEYLALLTKRLTFPAVIPQATGMIFGLRKSILETEVENIGDVATGFRVIFKAKGEVENVEVSDKLTGKKIKVLATMQKGDIIEVINFPKRKMVLFNGQKAFHLLDVAQSDFFTLEVGKNLLGYHAEKNAVNLDVVLFYSPLYLGR